MLLATQQAPPEVIDAIASARIIPLLKPNRKIRPIACGTAFRRLVTGAIATAIAPAHNTLTKPFQFATGKPQGCEHLHKLAQITLDIDRQKAILALDVKAAFSEMQRASILQTIQANFPTHENIIRPWITANATYNCRLNNDHTMQLKTTRGVPMGCPLAALAFTTTLHIPLQQIHNHLTQLDPTAQVYAYMDDITILIHHSHVHKAYTIVEQQLATIGLSLNKSKTECWIDEQTLPWQPKHNNVTRVKRPQVLKSTVTPTYLHTDHDNTNGTTHPPEQIKLINHRKALATRLQHLHAHGLPSHTAQALWRTTSAGDCNYAARTLGLTQAAATELDNITTNLINAWTGLHLDDHDNKRIFATISAGGLGFTATNHIKDTAYLASWDALAPALTNHTNAPTLGDLLDKCPRIATQIHLATSRVDPTIWEDLRTITPLSERPTHRQRQLTNLLRKLDITNYTESLNPRDKAQYLSTTGIGAGAWLHAPIGEIHPLTQQEFAIATALRLNKPLQAAYTTCQLHTDTNKCNKPINTHLDHTLTCNYGPHRIRRHNAICKELRDVVHHTTGHVPILEQLVDPSAQATTTNAMAIDDQALRSDLTISTDSIPIHVDVTVTLATSTTALAGTVAAHVTAGHAAKMAEENKRRHYGKHTITPFALEAHGRWGDDALALLRQLAAHATDPAQRTSNYHYSIQRIATTLQRHNANTIANHINNAVPAAAPAEP